MSWSGIKYWFSNVDISHVDWRLRWPLIILPFLLLSLLYVLFRANQLSGEQAQSTIELQKLVQSDAGIYSSAGFAQTANNGIAQIQSTFERMESNANQLQNWLTQGRNTQQYAEHAGTLLRLLGAQRAESAPLPQTDFWDGFSDVLAVLEYAVIEGQIKTPESRDLIDTLRLQYAQARSTQITTAELSAEPSADENVVTQTNGTEQHLKAINSGLVELREQRAAITRLHNRALILSALASLLFGLLLWGMWRTARNKATSHAGRNQHEQTAILRLLDEITPLASGDLRVKATVSEASTGAIADAFNFAVEELRRLVRAVTESAELVRSSVHDTRESAYHLARASSVQAREIHRSSNYLNVMSDTMAQLSAHAVESSRIADLSVQQARTGNEAVQANVDALSRIREQAENTSRLMQRLVETSVAINERVSDIQAVAKRTDLLALNATIRSSAQVSNGDSENMSMLSEDIAHLANTLGRATRDITNLSGLIQQDATITLESMAKTVTELDDGQRTAILVSDSLHEIDRVSNDLNGLISDIASKSLRQAGVVKQLSANMGVINNITSDSTNQLQDSARALKQLQTITTELRDSVSDFKLPRERDPSASQKQAVQRSQHQQPATTIQSKVARPKNARVPVKHA